MGKIKALILILIIFFISNCSESVNNIPVDEDIISEEKVFDISTEFDISDTNTTFTFKIKLSQSPTSVSQPPKIEKVKWDFNSDGEYDTDWMIEDSIKYRFNNIGVMKISSLIRSFDGTNYKSTREVYICKSQNLLEGNSTHTVHEMCYSFDESEIYFVWGNLPHHIYKMKKDGSFIEGITTDFSTDRCRHYPIASHDGKYLLYTYNGINLLNLDSNEEFKVYNSVSIYFNFIKNKILFNHKDGIMEYDIQTKGSNLIFNQNYSFSVLPDENSVAYISRSENINTLNIYNLTTKSITESYNNIPYASEFKFLDDQSIIYYKETHVLFFLETNKKLKIYCNGMYDWISEISSDGKSLLYSIPQGLLKLELPDAIF